MFRYFEILEFLKYLCVSIRYNISISYLLLNHKHRNGKSEKTEHTYTRKYTYMYAL